MELPDIEGIADDITRRVRAGAHVWLTGPEGSGRNLIVGALRSRIENAVVVDPPLLDDPDASSALLLLATSGLGLALGDHHVDQAGRPTERLHQDLRQRDVPLIVRLNKVSHLGVVTEVETELQRKSLEQVFRILEDRPRIVWIADHAVQPGEGTTPRTQVSLPSHTTTLPLGGWEGWEHHALVLGRSLGDTFRSSPIVWRLAVGALALGAPVAEVSALCRAVTPSALVQLSTLMASKLSLNLPLARAVQRLVLIRRPTPRAEALAAVNHPPEFLPLFGQCLAYGDPLRVNPIVRSTLAPLLKQLSSRNAEQAHADLANRYQLLDGAADPRTLSPKRMTAWVEKVHHLGRAGNAGEDLWREQVFPFPDAYREHARYLSLNRQYQKAADVYRDCIGRFPADDYAWHYFAYNLEKAGGPAKTVREGYAKAVSLMPHNPWWNARLICNLISQKDLREARRAWGRALEHQVLQNGPGVPDLWTVANVHYRVADAWLKAGAWYEARSIYEKVPEGSWRQANVVGKPRATLLLKQRFLKAEQEEQLQFERWMSLEEAEPWRPLGELFRQASRQVPGLPIPIPSRGEDGPQLTWSHPAILLQIEQVGPNLFYWFAHDRLTGENASDEVSNTSIELALATWLHRVRHA